MIYTELTNQKSAIINKDDKIISLNNNLNSEILRYKELEKINENNIQIIDNRENRLKELYKIIDNLKNQINFNNQENVINIRTSELQQAEDKNQI